MRKSFKERVVNVGRKRMLKVDLGGKATSLGWFLLLSGVKRGWPIRGSVTILLRFVSTRSDLPPNTTFPKKTSGRTCHYAFNSFVSVSGFGMSHNCTIVSKSKCHLHF